MSLWSRLFGRKPPAPRPPVDRRGWTEDWQVGDLAQCLVDQFDGPTLQDPKRGEVLRVAGLWEGVDIRGAFILSGLSFEGRSPNSFWVQSAFRKIRPAEQCFIDEMRNLHPTDPVA